MRKILFILCLTYSLALKASSPEYIQLADSADHYISLELWDKAEQKIIEALRLEPANFENSLLLSNLGIIRIQKEQYPQAIESFSLGLSIAPSSTVLYNNRAKAFLLSENINEAMDDLDSSLAIDSIQEWPLQTRAFLYLKEYQLPQASGLFKLLKEHFPSNHLAYSGLAEIASREGNTLEAISLYQKSIELNPKDEETLSSYILMLIEADKYSDARTLIRKCISDFPENPMFYLLRGYLHRLNFRMEEAKADKKIAIDKGLDPGFVSQFIP